MCRRNFISLPATHTHTVFIDLMHATNWKWNIVFVSLSTISRFTKNRIFVFYASFTWHYGKWINLFLYYCPSSRKATSVFHTVISSLKILYLVEPNMLLLYKGKDVSWVHINLYNKSTAWFKKMDSILYIYVSWTIQGMWMFYTTFQRRGSKFSNTIVQRSPSASCAAASVESKMATMQHKIFCVPEFIKTESPTAVQRAFRLRFNINLQRGRAFVVEITNFSK